MKTIDISIGEKSYTVPVLTIRKAEAWRAKIEEVLGDISDAFSADAKMVDVVDRIKTLVLKSPTLALQLVYAYAPAIAEDSEWIEENGYDEEIVEAFVKVLKVAYPLGELKSMVLGFMGRTTKKS